MEENLGQKKPVGVRLIRGFFVAFGLLLLNLIFVLGPYIGLWGIIVGFTVSGFALIASGLTLIFAYLFTIPAYLTVPALLIEHPVLMLMSSGILIGLGGIFMSLFIWLSKYVCVITGKYAMWHVDVIRGDEYE